MHRQQVEPVLVIGAPIAEPPNAGHPGYVSLLSPADCLQPRSAGVGATSLHLHERDRVPLTNDQVDVMAAQLESVGFNHPAARREIGNRVALSLKSEHMALIFPFSGRGESAGYSHAAMIPSGTAV
jgi:hypothetical protein